jgi:signal transduction histidine kinase
MKKRTTFFLFVSFFFTLSNTLFDNKSFSQFDSSQNVFYIKKISARGILLDRGWKFHADDTPEYSKAEYDDSKWQSINPTSDIHDLPQIKQGIVWFRLHLLIDSTSLKDQLALMIQQSGASQVYLNGALIQSFGVLSDDTKKIKAYDPLWKPILLPVNKDRFQVLAVRCELQPKIFYTTMFETSNPAISITIMNLHDAIDFYNQRIATVAGVNVLLIGVGIMLFILHMAFYVLYPSQRANLYFAIYALIYIVYSGIIIIFFLFSHEVADKFYLGNIVFSLMILGSLCILVTLQHFLERKADFAFYLLVVLAAIAIILNASLYQSGWRFGGIIILMLISMNVVRIAFISVAEKKRGALILATGSVCWLVFFIAFTLQGSTNSSFVLNFPEIRIATSLIVDLSIPAATSLFLALDFAFTNRSLRQKLIEVRNLSEESRRQQIEKIRLANELRLQQLEGEKTKADLERQAMELQIKAIVATQEEERKRISRDLHDDVGTKLSAVNLFLSSLTERATRANNEEIKLLAQSSKQILKETMTDVRLILRNLSPLVLEEYGYIAAVTGLANKINETKQVHFCLEVPDTPLQLDKENELMLYRITQELINNVLKHAEAKHVSLVIEKHEKKIVLKIEDDGKGFDVNVLKDGYGLHNLDARTKLMQGSFIINSQLGKGTNIIIEIPYDFNKPLNSNPDSQ